MNLATWTLLLSFLFLLASCQVKETSGSGLIAGHAPTTNAFTLNTPASDTLVTGDILTLTLSFPYNVTVTGTPLLGLTIGATARDASYVSGSGGKTLTFTYTIVALDEDTNGIEFTALNINGGTLEFSNNGTQTACSQTIAAATFSSVLVDNTGPTITAFTQSNLPGFYNLGDNLNFLMTFSEAVVVTGTPRIAVAFTTGGPVYATYSGGTGTTTLNFVYTIANSVADSNGYDFTTPLELNSGTIDDASGNDSSLVFAAYEAAAETYSGTVDFDGRLPFVSTVTPPANGTYLAAQALDVTVLFDRAVTVAGVPHITLTIGATARQATYLSGSGTNTLIFRYTTVPGDVDSDGIAIATTITQNPGGNITGTAAPTNSYFTTAANNVLSIPSTAGVLAGAVQPQPLTVARNIDSTAPSFGAPNPDNVWNIGQQLLITVGFNTGMFVNQSGGTPRIPLTIGVTTKYATYLSGGDGQTSLLFTYTIVEGDLDIDTAIAIADIDLNGGTIVDSAATNSLLVLPSASLTTTSIDGVKPVISSVTAPANATYSTLNIASFAFTINWSEAVHYSATTAAAAFVPLNIGGSTINAIYTSGNDTATTIHTPTGASITGQNDTDGIAINSPFAGSATFRDRAGNAATVLTFVPPATPSVLVDTAAPTVTSISAQPANDTYLLGEALDFDVTFSESVTINTNAGFPKIALTIGATARDLVPTSSGTATVHTFRYTIVASEVDTNGVAMATSVQVSALGYVRDAGLNLLTGSFTSPITTGVLVDAASPTITGVVKPVNGTYTSATALDFTLTFSEIVNITGNPRIQVAAQTGTLNFDYSSGTGSTNIVFRYTTTTSDFDFDGLSSAITTIDLNGGTILDGATNASATTFASQNLSGVFLAYPNTRIWVTSGLINLAPTAGATTTSSTGVVSSQACGTGTCRTFNGDDSLTNSSALNSVETAFIVFKAPAVAANQDLIVNDVALVDDTGAFDITSSASIDANGSVSAGPVHDLNLATSSVNILQIDYDAPENYPGGDIIPTSFLGAIGEVIMIDAALTAPQKAQILIYLNAKY